MANTLLNAVKDLRNDSLRDLVSASAFTGEEEAATSSFQVVTTVIFRAARPRGTGTLLKGFRLHLTVVEQMWVTCSKEDITVQGRVHQLMVILLLGSPGAKNTIDKFPFTSGFTTATDVGNLTGVEIRWRVKVLSLMDMVIILVVVMSSISFHFPLTVTQQLQAIR